MVGNYRDYITMAFREQGNKYSLQKMGYTFQLQMSHFLALGDTRDSHGPALPPAIACHPSMMLPVYPSIGWAFLRIKELKNYT